MNKFYRICVDKILLYEKQKGNILGSEANHGYQAGCNKC
jgi:hypothetical protein